HRSPHAGVVEAKGMAQLVRDDGLEVVSVRIGRKRRWGCKRCIGITRPQQNVSVQNLADKCGRWRCGGKLFSSQVRRNGPSESQDADRKSSVVLIQAN